VFEAIVRRPDVAVLSPLPQPNVVVTRRERPKLSRGREASCELYLDAGPCPLLPRPSIESPPFYFLTPTTTGSSLAQMCVWFGLIPPPTTSWYHFETKPQAVGCGVIEGIDVSDSDSGTKLVEAVKKQLGEGGTLDYVICNAGCVQMFVVLRDSSSRAIGPTFSISDGSAIPCALEASFFKRGVVRSTCVEKSVF